MFVLPVDHQPVQEAMNKFITWLSRAEEIAAKHPPLKADLISLKEKEIAHTVRICLKLWFKFGLSLTELFSGYVSSEWLVMFVVCVCFS